MKLLPGLTAAALLTMASTLRAQPPTPRPDATSATKDSDAYCRWVNAAAASESATFLAPSLYASGGYTTGADASGAPDGSTTLAPAPRLIAGASYSFGAAGLNHGLALRAQAAAECKRYATTALLRAFVERHHEPISPRGLSAKAKVLDDALPHAAETLATQRMRLAAARLTVDELDATALRVDALRELAATTHAHLDALAALPPLPDEPIRAVLARRDDAEAEAERSEARVRQSRGWDLAVRGGYDRVFGARDDAPFFVMGTVTLNLGWLFQGASDGTAAVARREWARSEVLGVDDRVEQALAMLRATRTAEISRLRDNRVLLADLEARFKEVSAIAGEKAKTYADAVWFDLVRLRADRAYLEEHVRELAVLLGDADR